MSWLLTAVVFLLMISVLVAAHEYGHFLFARLCGMEVEEFAIGMGRPAWVYARKNGTDYSLRAFPVGGFVRIKGMMPQEDGSEIHVENGFYSKSPYKRFIVLLAGPVFSILAGVIVMTALFTIVGEPSKAPIMGDFIVPSPAQEAGIQPGDLVLSVDGNPVSTFFGMRKYITNHANKQIVLVLKRGDQILTKTVVPAASTKPTPVLDDEGVPTGKEQVQGYIGVSPGFQMERMPLSAAVGDALKAPVAMGKGLFQTFTHPRTLSDSVGGPVSIVGAAHDAASEGLYQVLILASVLSISLGFMNLLPIVPLDGGQIMIAIAEMFRRRRLSIQIQAIVSSVGMALVGTLVLGVLWLDLKRLVTPKPEGITLSMPKKAPAPGNPAAPAKAVPKSK